MTEGEVPPLQDATALQRDVVRTLLYFDIFQHPLELREVLRFLPSNSVTVEDIERACSSAPLNRYLVETNGYVGLQDRFTGYIGERRRKERRARRLWQVAVLMSHIIRRFPFVRAVFVSGELSKGVASRNSDIDFFVITAANRIWIARTLFTAFKRLCLFNARKLFCYNHITSDRNLEIKDHNIYTATEVATLKPLYNMELYGEFMRANAWVKEYLPNSSAYEQGTRQGRFRRPLVERLLDRIMAPERLDAVDLWLLSQWRSLWRRRYHFLNGEKRGELFRCDIHLSTAYVNDFLARITQAYQQRLDQFGLTQIE